MNPFAFIFRPILDRINQLEQRTMSALDDLKAAVARVGASTSAEIKAVSDKITATGGGITADEAAGIVAQLNGISDTLDAETAALTAAPPSPPSPPAG